MDIKRIIIVAHPYEIGTERLLTEGFSLVSQYEENRLVYANSQSAIAIIGIGADEAGRSLKAMQEEGLFSQPVDILLTGSAGSYTLPVLSTVQCSSSLSDIDMGFPLARLECVHEFVSPSSPHPELHQPDTAFDMESETLTAFFKNNVRESVCSFSIVKVISDDGSGSLGDWAAVCQQYVQPRVMDVVKTFIDKTPDKA
ncbi:MAG: hypothetical protein IK000_05325 [Bacteroidaceae bacterium]|nr:hypothetical protein [Bacteroidaceae bacterium]